MLFHLASATNDDDDDSDDDPSIPEHPTSPDNMLRVITSPINHFEVPSNSTAILAVDHNDNNILDHSNNNTSYVNHNNNSNNNNTNRTSNNNSSRSSTILINRNVSTDAATIQNGSNGAGQKRAHHAQSSTPTTQDHNESSSSYNQGYDHTYSSRSNSRLSSSYDYDCSSSNDSFMDYFINKKKLMAGSSNLNQDQPAASGSGSVRKFPDYNRELLNQTPDSGIATGPCSSVSTNGGLPSAAKSLPGGTPGGESGSSNGNYLPGTSSTSGGSQAANNGNNGITDLGTKLFQQKVARVRKSYRKNFCDDSDSE